MRYFESVFQNGEIFMIDSIDETANKIEKVIGNLLELLLLKNKQYGNSVLDPIQIFAKGSAQDLIKVRIDDKLSRLARGNDSIESDRDIFMDLAGYCILWLVADNES